jgi:hypothetical protein
MVFQDCRACGVQMKLACSDPFPDLPKVDVRTFSCACGCRTEHLVARVIRMKKGLSMRDKIPGACDPGVTTIVRQKMILLKQS